MDVVWGLNGDDYIKKLRRTVGVDWREMLDVHASCPRSVIWGGGDKPQQTVTPRPPSPPVAVCWRRAGTKGKEKNKMS